MSFINKHKIFPFLNGCLSNWYLSDFTINGITYNCSEQWMMAEKARLFKDNDILEIILKSKSPGEQKRLGRKVRNFNPKVWNQYKKALVKKGIKEKFKQNTAIMEDLLSTGNQTLVEGNAKDTIWGVGLDWKDKNIYDPAKWRGKNLLGEILMEVRAELKKEIKDEFKLDI